MSNFDTSSFYNGGRRTNQQQKHILISAMATNRDILECRSSNSTARRAKEAAWNDVVSKLNMAGPEKNITAWKKVWTDLRLGMRKKWHKAQKSNYILTEYERRVIDACGMVDKSGNGNTHVDINSFLSFLKEELLKEAKLNHYETSNYARDDSNSTSKYLTDSSDYFAYQNPEVNFKEEFEEETRSFVKYISDNDDENENEQSTRIEEFREPSVECISDDEEPMVVDNIRTHSSPKLCYEESHGIEYVPQPIPNPEETVTRPTQIQCPEVATSPLSKFKNIKLPRRKRFKDATLKEIRKMHKNLLRQSKKQTALLRKLVQAVQR